MADPFTIASIGVSTFGSLVEGVGANNEARSEARVLDANADAVAMQGAEDVLYSLRQNRLQAGADLAASASGMVGAGNGTLAELMRANAEARWQQAFNIQTTASQEAAGLRARASATRRGGRMSLLGGVVRAGANALTGYSEIRRERDLDEALGRRRDQERRRPAPLGSIPLPGSR